MPPTEAHGAADTRPGDAKLGVMANQIAAFFRAYPEPEACAGIAQHIKDFWTPAMRRALQARIAAGGADGLDPLVIRALSATGSNFPLRVDENVSNADI
jgi:formate dehydrogenase subunit delta